MVARNLAYSAAGAAFRLANRVLNPLGVLISTPAVIHGSPAFSGAPVWSRRLWDLRAAFDLVDGVDGAIVESGVHWGYGILAMLHASGGAGRHIYGFDSFAGHSAAGAADRQGGAFLDLGTRFGTTPAAVWRTLELGTGLSRAELGERVTLVEGWMDETLPRFAASGPRVALAHVDPDLYAPVKATLEHVWPLLAPGGIMLVGKLGNPELPGKDQAVREFLAALPDGAAELRELAVGDTRLQPARMAYLVKRAEHVSLSRAA